MNEAEQLARQALAEARREAKPIEPDRWEKGEGEGGWVSFRRFEEVAGELLTRHGIEVDLVSSTIAANTAQTTWTWTWGEHTSAPVRVDVPLEIERGRALSAASGAVSTGWKIFVRQLLRIRTAEDPEGDLGKAMDSARAAAFNAVKDALRAYCKRCKCSPDRAIRAFTGIDPGPGVEATVEMLTAQAVSMLWWKLECHLPHESVKFDPGASPDLDDDLSVEMVGSHG